MNGMVITDMDVPAVPQAPEIKIPEVVLPSSSVPAGYLPVELSTNGKLGVPALIHCRNFKVGDLFDLSVFNDEVLPDRVIAVLNSLIYEDGVDVSLWPDKVIIELLVRIYINFFTPILQQVNFPWSDDDVQWLKDQGREEEAQSLLNRKWTPKIDLNLTAFKPVSLGDDVKPYVRIKKGDLNVKFLAYPRYGDTILVREIAKSQYGESDKKYDKIRLKYENIERMEARGLDTSHLNPNEEEFLDWQLYEAKKSSWLSKVTLALYLVEANGKDLTHATLQQRVDLVSDPLFDINLAKKLDDQYSKLKFGINPEVRLTNPITGGECTRHFTFRVVDVIQAISAGQADGYDVSFDD